MPSVRLITRIARVSAVAAITSARRASSERPRACVAKTVSRLSPTGTGCGSGSRALQLLAAQAAAQLEQGERIPAGRCDERLGDLRRDPHVRIVIEQRDGGLRVETSELELWESPRTEALAAGGEEHDDAFRLEPPRRERERAGRRLVEPVRVVDHAEERAVVSRGGEQAQRRGADVEAAGALRLGERQCAAQRVRLHRRQLRQPVEQRAHELVQARVRELRLGLDAERAHDPRIARSRDGVLEQGALADPGVAADDEGGAPAASRPLEHSLDPSAFALAADEHAAIGSGHSDTSAARFTSRAFTLAPALDGYCFGSFDQSD